MVVGLHRRVPVPGSGTCRPAVSPMSLGLSEIFSDPGRGHNWLHALKHRRMSELISAAQRQAGAVASEKHERSRIVLVSGTILLAITVAAVLLRLHRIAEIPPGIFFDEGAHGVDAVQVLQGQHAVFFPDNSGREALIVYAIALAHSLLGPSILALRLPTALSSAAAVLVLFWTGYVLFGTDEQTGIPRPWRGIFIGGVGAALLAVSLNHVVLGRLAFRANFLIFLLPLCLALLWRGWRQRNWLTITLAGLCAGILQYTYIPARLLPVLLTFVRPHLLDSSKRQCHMQSARRMAPCCPFCCRVGTRGRASSCLLRSPSRSPG